MNDRNGNAHSPQEPAAPAAPTASARPDARTARWRFRLTAWAIVLVTLALSIRYDRRLTAWGQEHLRILPNHVIVSLRDFGQITPVIAVTIALAIYDRRRGALVAAMIAAAAFAGLFQGIGKLVIHRYRPSAVQVAALAPDDWRSVWVGVGWEKEPTSLESFPSGHTCLAFAFAGVLSAFYPRARWLFWALAVGCGFSRYIDHVHWASDCIAGGALGYVAAWLALRPLRKHGTI
jgi:membrane-associated phospholipid phosphatase